MLVQPIVLDAVMTAAETLRRLARNGYWSDANEPEAKAWLKEQAHLLGVSPENAAQRLARSLDGAEVVIRRQWYANVLWYTRPISYVIEKCRTSPPDRVLVDTLDLHESDSAPPIPPPSAGGELSGEGMILTGDNPLGVSISRTSPESLEIGSRRSLDRTDTSVPDRTLWNDRPAFSTTESWSGTSEAAAPQSAAAGSAWVVPDFEIGASRGFGGTGVSVTEPERIVETWPRLDAPSYVPALKAFDIVVGFSRDQHPGVLGRRIKLPFPAQTEEILVTVELTALGVKAPGGWIRPLRVKLDDPTSSSVAITLVGLEPPGPEPVLLTMLEVRYLLENGEVCGTASKPLVVGKSDQPTFHNPITIGTPWLTQPAAISAVTAAQATDPPDLTIELLKPDGNVARGNYVCWIRSPHPITAASGPYQIDFGEDAKTFARSIVDQIRHYGSTALANNYFRSFGTAVTSKLPPEAFDALREVAAITAPIPPAVMFVSAEPYVPWELTLVDPPLDPGRPPYLGAQVALGRWLRDKPISIGPAPGGIVRVEKPPTQPLGEISVRHMAVVAGVYPAISGFRSLPEAQKEAKKLTAIYGAIPLAASAQSISQLLDARLEHNFQVVGGADVVHFAGHGEFDPARPDSSVLYLSDGMPLASELFLGAKYGGPQQPIIFLNACMIGIGGEMLGNMGGFPGNCLKGGFGSVLGALWEVNDALAHAIAVKFWERVLPPDGGLGEPVAEVLRDMRAAYAMAGSPVVPTYLAYVFYGHPRLRLRRIV